MFKESEKSGKRIILLREISDKNLESLEEKVREFCKKKEQAMPPAYEKYILLIKNDSGRYSDGEEGYRARLCYYK